MPNYAVHNGSTILNVIVAETLEIAESLTGLNAVLSVEGNPWIGWTLQDDGWRPPSPFPSWSWNGQEWEPPVPHPGNNDDSVVWVWNEDKQDWESYPRPAE